MCRDTDKTKNNRWTLKHFSIFIGIQTATQVCFTPQNWINILAQCVRVAYLNGKIKKRFKSFAQCECIEFQVSSAWIYQTMKERPKVDIKFCRKRIERTERKMKGKTKINNTQIHLEQLLNRHRVTWVLKIHPKCFHSSESKWHACRREQCELIKLFPKIAFACRAYATQHAA